MISETDLFRVALITLGCSKNLVDAECMSRILTDDGYEMITDASLADAIIINTCGFIESAKTEAINTILEASENKYPKGRAKFIIVTGCLSQRYPEEILSDLPEVDAVLGTNHYQDISKVLGGLISGSGNQIRKMVSKPGGLLHMRENRIVSTRSYAYLKISEGCSNACSFCAIPLIRGPFRSRPDHEIISEAKILVDSGFHEIIITAQDSTNYGIDLYGKRTLPLLLSKLSQIEGDFSIRIMYSYMDGISDELIDEMIANPKILHYLDIPVQHGDNHVLERMGRKETAESITHSLATLRSRIPDIVIRSTVIVGFPGETEEEFHHLLNNIQKWQFDRLGCFIFSPEENTRANGMPNQVSTGIAQKRYEQVMKLQQKISSNKNTERLKSIVRVTIDSISDDGIFYIGRSYAEAPEVDPSIFVLAAHEELTIGNQYWIQIVESSIYDMTGVTLHEYTK